MSYTFGAAVTNRVEWSSLTLGSASRVSLQAGWYYPTTLTATRKLWGAGASLGVEIDATTSELRLRTKNATTDGAWTTSGAGIAVNNYYFVASVLNAISTPGAAWRVWVGTLQAPPVEVTVTQATAPVGAFTSSTALAVGNAGATTNFAFQGDISDFFVCSTNAGAGAGNPFGIAAYGAITNTEVETIYRRFIVPLWLGHVAPLVHQAVHCDSMGSEYASLNGLLVARRAGGTAANPQLLATATGAVLSSTGGPRPAIVTTGRDFWRRRR